MRRNGLAGLGAGLALALLLGACATGGTSPTTAPAADPTATPASAPVGMFTGRDECRDVPQTDPSAADDAEAITCDRVVTDARMSGTLLSDGLPKTIGADPAVYTSTVKLTLTNDGGTWTCDELLMGPMAGGVGFREQVCVGHGAYNGLTAYIHSTSNDAASTFGVLGWIEETK